MEIFFICETHKTIFIILCAIFFFCSLHYLKKQQKLNTKFSQIAMSLIYTETVQSTRRLMLLAYKKLWS